MCQSQINRQAVIDFMESRGWYYRHVRAKRTVFVVELDFLMDNDLNGVHAHVTANERRIACVSVCDKLVSKDVIKTVDTFVTLVNLDHMVGQFDLDYATGMIRYRAYLPSRKGIPDQALVAQVINSPRSMFDRYGEGLLRCLQGTGDPAVEALRAT